MSGLDGGGWFDFDHDVDEDEDDPDRGVKEPSSGAGGLVLLAVAYVLGLAAQWLPWL